MRRFFICLVFGIVCSGTSSAAAQTAEQIREAQSLLVRSDRNPGPIDGVWGGRTEAALVDFLAERNAEFDGQLSENELELLRVAPWGERFRQRPYTSNGRIVAHITTPRGLTTFPGQGELPEYLDPAPNDVTLGFHFNRWLRQGETRRKFLVEPAGNAEPFEYDLRASSFLDEQIRTSSMLSYLYYEDGKIIYDAIAPAERFRLFQLSNETEFRSQSVGKSFVSYVVGHAICEGFIDSLNSRLNDWPLIETSLYADRTVLEVLNMRARDSHVVTEDDGFVRTGRWFNDESIANFATAELANTSPGRDVFNYNGFATNILLNYVAHKAGEEFQALLHRVFQDHVGIERRFYFHKLDSYSADDQGVGWYSAYATRYDYLRIAQAMLEDWHSDTCIGQYLRDIYAERQSNGWASGNTFRMSNVARTYGGQFWFELSGMRDRTLFGMNGNNGQNVLIDMDNGRIIVLNAAHTDFPWRELVYDAMRDGGLPN